ncbi:MAG: ROK family protein [Candidatus Omnitrophica bacterium]|nr:ROK family protein [Candidatus Omnitrophota bacterium]MDD5081049.1 ROK family protein [Candidatus Omnitrophota bacterium]
MDNYLGIDWGGTNIDIGVVNSSGSLIARSVYPTSSNNTKEKFLELLKNVLALYSKYNIKAIGIGAPGLIDIKNGKIFDLPNVPGWKNYPISKEFGRSLKKKVFINNDANVFTLAECKVGLGGHVKNALFFTLGTGLGSGVVINGELLYARTSAAELAHIPITVNGQKCGCGSNGCIETYLGNAYLIRNYKKKTGIKKEITVKELYERALLGEKAALSVWEEFSFYFGRFLAGMVNLFNPEVIILGGGVSGAYNLFKPMVLAHIKRYAMAPLSKGLKIKKAKIKHAGIIGAALWAASNCAA